MSRVPFITVEGPIGVGKTSLAKVISMHFQYELLKEIVDENPFLGKFATTTASLFDNCNVSSAVKDVERYGDK